MAYRSEIRSELFPGKVHSDFFIGPAPGQAAEYPPDGTIDYPEESAVQSVKTPLSCLIPSRPHTAQQRQSAEVQRRILYDLRASSFFQKKNKILILLIYKRDGSVMV